MSGTLQLQRRTDLYGPGRTLERQTARQLQQADHVKTNLQKCPGGIPRSQTFNTTTALSLKEGTSARSLRDISVVDTQRQYQSSSHIHLGNIVPPSHSLTKADFISKPVPQYKRHVADRTISVPDMAPQYMASKRFWTTHYLSSYDADKATKSVERIGIGCSKESMRFHKTTHFELGDHFESPESTTGFTFKGRPVEGCLPLPSLTEQGKTKSSVFREGDYNVVSTDAEEWFTSTQKKDFRVRHKPVTACVHLPKSYSHVLPRCSTKEDPVGRLRRILAERNRDEFTNPRDPTSINVVRAFTTYDKTKCGSIGIDDIRAMNKIFEIPLNDGDIDSMLRECGCKEGEKMDFYMFCDYLTAHTVPLMNPGEYVSSSMDSYREKHQTETETNRKEYQIEAEFQTGTHFQLGSEGPSARSVYGKDFDSTRMMGPVKADREPRPRNSKVMHEYSRIPKGASTSRTAYTRYDSKASRADRSQDCREFKDKQEKLTFEIGNQSEEQDDQKMSVTMLSYRKPQSVGSLTADPPVRKDYHHLESDRALPHPLAAQKRSEVEDKYVVHLQNPEDYSQQRGQNIGERTNRDLHNKGTHFVFGSGYDPKTSETRAQFGDKKAMTPSTLSAGIVSLPTQGYPIMEHNSEEGSYTAGTQPGNIQQSIQRRNYQKNINPRDTVNLNLRKAFLEYDTDLSGAITRDQLKAVCKTMTIDASEEEIDRVIYTCDKKGDGLIDYNEFAQCLTQVCPPSSRVFQTSVTRRDFRDPQKQRISESRRTALAKDSRRFQTPNIQPSHYFHIDHSKEKMQSVMGKDFVPPEYMHQRHNIQYL